MLATVCGWLALCLRVARCNVVVVVGHAGLCGRSPFLLWRPCQDIGNELASSVVEPGLLDCMRNEAGRT